jgi:ZIP family zinc transporter
MGLALVLGTVLDGLPESIVLGLSFSPGAGVGLAVLVAIAVSNVPEGLSATRDLREGGLPIARVLALWLLVAAASGVAAALGFGVLGPMGSGVTVALQAFAAGAIVAMLAESMIPEAHESGGRAVGLATALGFAVAAGISLRT